MLIPWQELIILLIKDNSWSIGLKLLVKARLKKYLITITAKMANIK
jgi:hypothetical protein